MKLRSTVKCHGGKSYLWPWLVRLFPENYREMNYGEACFGGGAVTLNKPRSKTEVVNDANPALVNMYRFLIQDPQQFIDRLYAVPYSEVSFIWAKNHVQQQDLESAVAELCIRRMSRGGLKKNFSWSQRERGGRPGDLNSFETFKEHLQFIAQRLQGVVIENMDIMEFVAKYNQPEYFLYLDPPYLPSTRRSTKAYDIEMTEEEHSDLCDLLVDCNCKVLISGYQSPLYLKKLKTWNFTSTAVVNHSGQTKRKEMRIECAWSNY